jgi:hypothetical protein
MSVDRGKPDSTSAPPNSQEWPEADMPFIASETQLHRTLDLHQFNHVAFRR